MKRWITYIVFLMSVAGSVNIKGQDPQFSQFYSNPLYLGPSFAGLIQDTRLSVNYRSQWRELPQPFNTFSFGADHNFHTFNSGAGFYFMKDKAGSGGLTTTTMSLQYAYDIKFSNYWHIRPGLDFKYTERKLDFSELLWADQISAAGNSSASSELPPLENIGDIDVGTSVMAYSDKFWIGFAVDHLMKPNQSLYFYEDERNNFGYVPLKYTIFGGTKIINQGRLFKPYDASLQIAALYKMQEGFNQLDLGLYWYRKPLVLGIWYRGMTRVKEKISRDAIILVTGFKIDQFNIGYSYDFTISRLLGGTGGAHEVSISYLFNTRIEKKKLGSVPCPDF